MLEELWNDGKKVYKSATIVTASDLFIKQC